MSLWNCGYALKVSAASRVFKLQESGIFVEGEQQDLKRKSNEEEDTDGPEGSEDKVAQEYPE